MVRPSVECRGREARARLPQRHALPGRPHNPPVPLAFSYLHGSAWRAVSSHQRFVILLCCLFTRCSVCARAPASMSSSPFWSPEPHLTDHLAPGDIDALSSTMLAPLLPLLTGWTMPAAAWSAVGTHAWSCSRSDSLCSVSGSSSSSSLVGLRRALAEGSTRAPAPEMGGRRPRPQQRPPAPKDNTPINEGIDFAEMRVVIDQPGEADEMLGVMTKAEALAKAKEMDLDLVLIVKKGDVPVCKIVSYDKYRYAKEKKKKEQKAAASKGQELKELKMSYKIGEHDYE
eukprot:6692385-Prymnesium_polylepis.1